MTCMPAHLSKIMRGDIKPERHVWRRSWRERIFGTVPLKKCECGRICWWDRGWQRYSWNVFPPDFNPRNS